MVAEDLLNNCQAKSSAPLFAVTNKGLENSMSDWLGDTRTIVRDADLQAILSPRRCYSYPPGIWRDRFASIEHDVRDHLLQPSRIEPTLGQAFVIVSDRNPSKLRSYRDDTNRAPDGVRDVCNFGPESFRVLGELQKQ